MNVIDVMDDSSSSDGSELPELNSSALPGKLIIERISTHLTPLVESQDYEMLDEIEISPAQSPRAQSPHAQSLRAPSPHTQSPHVPIQPVRACSNTAKSQQSAPEYDRSFEFWYKVLPPVLSQYVGEFALSNLNDSHLAEIDAAVIFKLANGNLELYCNVTRAIKDYKAAYAIEQ